MSGLNSPASQTSFAKYSACDRSAFASGTLKVALLTLVTEKSE
jgi:hypothetical protein